MASRSSDAPMATDQSQVLGLVGDLLAAGARRGAAQVLFNANLIAQREAAEVRDLSQRAVFGRRVKAQPQPHAANDQFPVPSEQPAPPVA